MFNIDILVLYLQDKYRMQFRFNTTPKLNRCTHVYLFSTATSHNSFPCFLSCCELLFCLQMTYSIIPYMHIFLNYTPICKFVYRRRKSKDMQVNLLNFSLGVVYLYIKLQLKFVEQVIFPKHKISYCKL